MLLRALTAALVVLPAVASAQAPKIFLNEGSPGEYIIEIATPPVLDYSFHGSKTAGTELTLQQDVSGKLTGYSKTSGVTISSEASISGKVKTREGLPYVQMTTVDRGVIDGDPTYAVGKLRAFLSGWGSSSLLVGELFMKLCMTMEDPITEKKRRICMPNHTVVEEQVPDIGTWQVMLSLERIGDHLEGLGWLVTSAKRDETARLFEFDAHGKISPKTGLAKLTIRPQKPSPGTVTLIGTLAENAHGQAYFAAIHEVKGKLLGQSFNEVFEAGR